MRWRTVLGTSVLFVLACLLACTPTVKVQAPDEPIVINLNVKIQHDIRIRVDSELDDLYAENDEIF